MFEKVNSQYKENDIEYLINEIPLAIKQTLEGAEAVTKIVRSMKDFSHPGTEELVATDVNRAIESTVTVSASEWKYITDLKLNLEENLPCW